jgi:hypothetical protein
MSTPPYNKIALALQIGVIIVFQLRSSQYPTNPHKV